MTLRSAVHVSDHKGTILNQKFILGTTLTVRGACQKPGSTGEARKMKVALAQAAMELEVAPIPQ